MISSYVSIALQFYKHLHFTTFLLRLSHKGSREFINKTSVEDLTSFTHQYVTLQLTPGTMTASLPKQSVDQAEHSIKRRQSFQPIPTSMQTREGLSTGSIVLQMIIAMLKIEAE
jgi:hypothetical protein